MDGLGGGITCAAISFGIRIQLIKIRILLVIKLPYVLPLRFKINVLSDTSDHLIVFIFRFFKHIAFVVECSEDTIKFAVGIIQVEL